VPVPSSLASGSYTVNVTYAGNGNYTTSTAAIPLSVGKIATSVSLASSANPAAALGSVTLTATISASGGPPTGSVSFYDGSTLLATVNVAAGQASYTTTGLAAGTHTITAVYSGDSNFQTSTSAALMLSVQRVTATATVVASANPVLVTTPVTFTATVSSSSGTPTGSVGFYDGTTLLGTLTISSGKAAYTTSSLTAGTHSITASYSGDSTFQAIASAATMELVQDFSVSTPTSGTGNSPTATVAPGGTATYTLSIGPTTGTVFPAPVSLSLSGLPPGATGTLSPQTLPAGSSLTNVTLTIQLPSQTAAVDRSFGWITPALALLLLPFGGRIRRGRKAFERCFLLLLLLAGLGSTAGLTGCGAKNTGFFGQAEQTYQVMIIATSGSVSHSTSVTLIVQ
jgi:hypothetical protein